MRPLPLATPQALLGALDTVYDCIAQHVLEGGSMRSSTCRSSSPSAFDDQLGALSGFRGRLPHDARETLHVALERTMRVRIRPFCNSVIVRA